VAKYNILQEKSFYLDKEQTNTILQNAEEICKILAKIILTTKQKLTS
jgi:hypothetical protein